MRRCSSGISTTGFSCNSCLLVVCLLTPALVRPACDHWDVSKTLLLSLWHTLWLCGARTAAWEPRPPLTTLSLSQLDSDELVFMFFSAEQWFHNYWRDLVKSVRWWHRNTILFFPEIHDDQHAIVVWRCAAVSHLLERMSSDFCEHEWGCLTNSFHRPHTTQILFWHILAWFHVFDVLLVSR